MAKVRDARLETRTARRRLKPRRKPYWVRVAPIIWLGYRALQRPPGTWNVGGNAKRWIRKIAYADDLERANGKTILDFWQGQEAAKKVARGEDGTRWAKRSIAMRGILELRVATLTTRAERASTSRVTQCSPPLLRCSRRLS